MKNTATEEIRAKVLSLVESEYESDAAFERAIGIPDKTVNNWRRGRSASFMKMLLALSELFRVNISELMDMPIKSDTSELSPDELDLLMLYRRARTMPQNMRTALNDTLKSTISLYLVAYREAKAQTSKRAKK